VSREKRTKISEDEKNAERARGVGRNNEEQWRGDLLRLGGTGLKVIRNQDIRDQERGEKANLRRFLGVFLGFGEERGEQKPGGKF
jgi:hypothetical protein